MTPEQQEKALAEVTAAIAAERARPHASLGRKRKPRFTGVRPACLFCGKPLRTYAYPHHLGVKVAFGGYGDGRFCGLNCGYKWALRATETRRKP